MDAVLGPGASGGIGDAVVVEGAGDLGDALPRCGEREDALHDGGSVAVGLQPRALLRPVLDVDLVVAVGRAAGDPETARGGLAHPACDLLGKIVRVELVDALDDCFHELAGGGVVGVFRNGDDADAAAAQHGLEGDGVLAFAREAGDFQTRISRKEALGPVASSSILRNWGRSPTMNRADAAWGASWFNISDALLSPSSVCTLGDPRAVRHDRGPGAQRAAGFPVATVQVRGSVTAAQ